MIQLRKPNPEQRWTIYDLARLEAENASLRATLESVEREVNIARSYAEEGNHEHRSLALSKILRATRAALAVAAKPPAGTP